MLVWETDTSLRSTPAFTEFAELWTALPKVVFSYTPMQVQGNARLATAPLADEIRTLLASWDNNVEIGGAGLAGHAFELCLLEDVRMFRLRRRHCLRALPRLRVPSGSDRIGHPG